MIAFDRSLFVPLICVSSRENIYGISAERGGVDDGADVAKGPDRYKVEVIDLLENPKLAKGDQIVAIPTLVRKLPDPVRRVIGDLSNIEKTLIGLQLRPRND